MKTAKVLGTMIAVYLTLLVAMLTGGGCRDRDKFGAATPAGVVPAEWVGSNGACVSADGGSCTIRLALPQSSVGTAYIYVAGQSPVYDGGHLNGATVKYSCGVETYDAGFTILRACTAAEALVFSDAGTVDSAFTTAIALVDGGVAATVRAHKLVGAPTTWKATAQFVGVP